VVDSQFPDSAEACVAGLQERSKNRGVDVLINTHHHGDHTGGNVAFKGVAKRVLAHERALELHKEVASRPGRGGQPTAEQLFADRTFTDVWREQIGDEWVRAKFYGRAHTSGDAVITLERANVAHMGDLMFNRRHPVVDRPAGASMANWIVVLEAAMRDHTSDTVYIFGHGGMNQPVTGPAAELVHFRDYLTALLAFVKAERAAGKSREEILAIRDPLKGFEAHGALTANILGNAYDDVAEGIYFSGTSAAAAPRHREFVAGVKVGVQIADRPVVRWPDRDRWLTKERFQQRIDIDTRAPVVGLHLGIPQAPAHGLHVERDRLVAAHDDVAEAKDMREHADERVQHA
jgi:glyoxylase-like metal-dependent hydrolase (beta-lactamase superfamily II)